MTKILLDQGIPHSTTHLMKEAGWEVVHVSDIRMNRAADEAILAGFMEYGDGQDRKENGGRK